VQAPLLKLLGHSKAIARQWGCEAMRMTVIHLREELPRYYERQGYRRDGDCTGREALPARLVMRTTTNR
jgi:hypothetical protein